MINKNIKNILIKYREKIVTAGIPVTSMYLFGSNVTGKTHPGSDIDVCIVSPKFGKNSINERVSLMQLADGISDLIEPHPFSPADFSSKYDPLANEIKRYGAQI